MQDFSTQIPIDDTWTVYGNTTGVQYGYGSITTPTVTIPNYPYTFSTGTTSPTWIGQGQSTIAFPDFEYTNVPNAELAMYKVREEIGTLFVLGKIDPEQFRNMWELSKSEDKEVINLLRIMISEIQTKLISELV